AEADTKPEKFVDQKQDGPVVVAIDGSAQSTEVLKQAAQAAEETAAELRILMIIDRKSTRLNSSHVSISYAVFCLKKKNGKSAEREAAHPRGAGSRDRRRRRGGPPGSSQQHAGHWEHHCARRRCRRPPRHRCRCRH